jgi:hypothetical protein
MSAGRGTVIELQLEKAGVRLLYLSNAALRPRLYVRMRKAG